MLDTRTKKRTNRLTVRQTADRLDDSQLQALADINAGIVRSLRPARASAVQFTDGVGTAWTVTETVHRLEAAGLAERVGTAWRLTPAGALILKRHAGGAL